MNELIIVLSTYAGIACLIAGICAERPPAKDALFRIVAWDRDMRAGRGEGAFRAVFWPALLAAAAVSIGVWILARLFSARAFRFAIRFAIRAAMLPGRLVVRIPAAIRRRVYRSRIDASWARATARIRKAGRS